jgi:hypothetical protein
MSEKKVVRELKVVRTVREVSVPNVKVVRIVREVTMREAPSKPALRTVPRLVEKEPSK